MTCCSNTGCEGKVKARGLCDKHYLQAKRAGDLLARDGPGAGRRSPDWARACEGVHVCGKPVLARGVCGTCYQTRRRDGTIPLLPMVNQRLFAVPTGVALVALGYSLWRQQRSQVAAVSQLGPQPESAVVR